MADLYSRIMSRGLPHGIRHVEHKTTQTIQHTTFRDVAFTAAATTQQWSPQNVRGVLAQQVHTAKGNAGNSGAGQQHTETNTQQRQSGQPIQVEQLQLPNNPQPIAQFLTFVQHTQPEGKLLVRDIVQTVTQRTEEITIVVERERTYHFNSMEVRAGLAAIMQDASPAQLVNTDIRQLLADTIRKQQNEQQPAQPDVQIPTQSTQQLVMAQQPSSESEAARTGNTGDGEPPLSIDGQFETSHQDLLTTHVAGSFKDATA